MMLGNNSNEQQLENGSSGINVEAGGGGDGGVQLKKGPWTATEDSVLTEYVRKHGEGNWNAVQRNTGLARCGKSCRLRWANHLRPNLKKGAFSPEEERLIVELHAQLGNKWARMAAQLPGRTDNEIKNYWNTRIKRRHRQGLPLYPPEIQPQHKHHQLNHPQSSQSHHSYHSTPSTPTTPNSASFSFHTTHTTPNTPTATHHHHSYHHHPYPPPCYSRSRSQTPTSLSPTPPQLSPSLQSPNFPTLSLFDSTNGHHSNHPNSNTNMNNPFNLPRTPPILQNPIRFKRFHPDSNNINNISNNNPSNNNPSMENSHNNMNMSYQNNNFSLPFSPQFLRGSSSPMLIPQSTNGNNNNNNNLFSNNSKLLSIPSFSSIPVNYNAQNSSMFRSPVEKDGFLSNGSGSFSLKPELPSNQALSQQNGNGEMNFDNEKLSVSSSGSGLLEDLLEEAQAMASNYGDSSRRLSGVGSIEDQNKREFGGFNQWSDSNSLNLSSGMKPKEENEQGQMNTMHEDLSKLLNVIPSMQVPEWYNDCGEASNCQSSVVTDDNIGLEMQHIASLFRVDSNTGHVSRNQGSCSFDNFPGI